MIFSWLFGYVYHHYTGLPMTGSFFEIDDETDRHSGDTEVVEHLTAFDIGNAFNGFRIHDNFTVNDKVRYEFSDLYFPPVHGEWFLLLEWYSPMAKFHNEGIFIRLFMQAINMIWSPIPCSPQIKTFIP